MQYLSKFFLNLRKILCFLLFTLTFNKVKIIQKQVEIG